MQEDFWHAKWQAGEIGFHLRDANPMLVKHFAALNLSPESRIFIPLCGKTKDIHWLLDQGFSVVGVELSELAIQQLFAELGVEPLITETANFRCYSAENIQVYVGDFFSLSTELLGDIDAVYDRAALVALPGEMRTAYSKTLSGLVPDKPQLLLTFVYDQSKMAGPPFSVSESEVKQHYGTSFSLTLLEEKTLPSGLKGLSDARENVWLLFPDTAGFSDV